MGTLTGEIPDRYREGWETVLQRVGAHPSHKARIRLTWLYLPSSALGAGSQQHQGRQNWAWGRGQAGGGEGGSRGGGLQSVGKQPVVRFQP